MLTATHDPWAQAMFTLYVTRLFRRHFHALRLLGQPPDPEPAHPLVIVPNHSTWWDGFFVYFLNLRLLGRRLHLMMLEEQLDRFRFFRRIGAFGIRPGSPRSVAKALDYSASVLADPANALCLFPQGEMRHPETRPLRFRRGLERILTRYGGRVTLLPLAIRCDFYEDQRPEALFLFDRCRVAEPCGYPAVDWLEQRVGELLEETGRAVCTREPGRILLSGRKQLSERRGRRETR
jgi:1-acyl-sn-glycerol-3-phosphate acyltransferase